MDRFLRLREPGSLGLAFELAYFAAEEPGFEVFSWRYFLAVLGDYY